MRNLAIITIWMSLVSMRGSLGEQCGKQAGGAVCPGGLCCSHAGWCGSTSAYCCEGCQSQCHCPPPVPVPPTPPRPPCTPPRTDLASLISEELFDELLPYRNDPRCPAAGFYTYEAFLAAAACYPDFAGVGDNETRKREIAAFLGQTSHETTGGWPSAPCGPFCWGYCFKEEIGCPYTYCVTCAQYPCVAGKKYCGRGPIQISYNYNYGPAGIAIGYDLLTDPDAVARDPIISFETALWFWMTPQPPKPSAHDVIIGAWAPSPADIAANRLPGYGVITNIINGGLECGHGEDDRVKDRIGFYQRYCGIFGVSTGDNIDCYNQRPFGNSILPHIAMKLDSSS